MKINSHTISSPSARTRVKHTRTRLDFTKSRQITLDYDRYGKKLPSTMTDTAIIYKTIFCCLRVTFSHLLLFTLKPRGESHSGAKGISSKIDLHYFAIRSLQK